MIQPTVGVDFVSKTINVENKSLRMQLWDTAGQERFHSLIPSYIKDSSAAVIVFDITSIIYNTQAPHPSIIFPNGSITSEKYAGKKP
jgi:small GTP-binding protein